MNCRRLVGIITKYFWLKMLKAYKYRVYPYKKNTP
jgi:hypothetical protein